MAAFFQLSESNNFTKKNFSCKQIKSRQLNCLFDNSVDQKPICYINIRGEQNLVQKYVSRERYYLQ